MFFMNVVFPYKPLFWHPEPAPMKSGALFLLGNRSILSGPFGNLSIFRVSGRVARPFGFALTDPGRRLSRTRLFPEVTRIAPRLVSKGG